MNWVEMKIKSPKANLAKGGSMSKRKSEIFNFLLLLLIFLLLYFIKTIFLVSIYSPAFN